MDYVYVFYDGQCGFCQAIVRSMCRYDRGDVLRFASIDSEFAQSKNIVIMSEAIDSVVVLDQGKSYYQGDAILRLGKYLSGWWRLVMLLRIIPNKIRNLGYDGVAKIRRRLCSGNSCTPIPAAYRHKFLE